MQLQVNNAVTKGCFTAKPVNGISAKTENCFISVDNNEPITLMNLKPLTRYLVRVQLTRPGVGGEGPPGPDAILETDCPGKCTQDFYLDGICRKLISKKKLNCLAGFQ